MDDADFEYLVRSAQAGNGVSRELLFRALRHELRSQVRSRMGPNVRSCAVDSEDILQASLASAAHGLGTASFAGKKRFIAWIGRIIDRNVLMTLRHHLAAKRDIRRRTRLTDGQVLSGTGAPRTAAYRTEFLEHVEDALARLDPLHRVIFEFHALGDRSFERIASDLGLSSKGAVRHRYVQTVARLKAELREFVDENAGKS